MNVVPVEEGGAEAFEQQFLQRESHVHKAEGYAGFELLRRDSEGEYIVPSRWAAKESYGAWRDGELFKLSHRHADGQLADFSEVPQLRRDRDPGPGVSRLPFARREKLATLARWPLRSPS